jgi:DNA-binding winged helix-turn-helix (wHTH) protein
LATDLRRGFRLGQWTIEPLRGALIGPNGESQHLEPKVMDVFVYLAKHANELVSRDQLLESVWSKHVAADELLTGAVSDLRRALQDHSDDLKYIETIPKRGYRLIGEVRPLRRRTISWAVGIALVTTLTVLAVSSIDWRLGDTVPGPITSIAVLPLDNLSGDPEQAYFTDGMTEVLIAELGQIKALRVISRTSSDQFKDTDKLLPEIAQELGVDILIEGSVLRAGD